jgi:hypothetical protein
MHKSLSAEFISINVHTLGNLRITIRITHFFGRPHYTMSNTASPSEPIDNAINIAKHFNLSLSFYNCDIIRGDRSVFVLTLLYHIHNRNEFKLVDFQIEILLTFIRKIMIS